jgi:hypothetical protein
MQRNRWAYILLSLACIFTFQSGAIAQRSSRSRGGDVYVKPYFRKDGTFVDGHMRSSPDKDFYNNWSTKGNVNPYTGKEGTKYWPDGTPVVTPSRIQRDDESAVAKPKQPWKPRPISERLSIFRIGQFNPKEPTGSFVQKAIDFGFGSGYLTSNESTFISLDFDFVQMTASGLEASLSSALLTYRWFARPYRAHGPYVGISGGFSYSSDWWGSNSLQLSSKLRAGLMFNDGLVLEGAFAYSESAIFQGTSVSIGYRF